MEISINGESEPKQEVRNVVIHLNGSVSIRLSTNKFGELVINKNQFGEDEGAIIVKPSVSNEIRIL